MYKGTTEEGFTVLLKEHIHQQDRTSSLSSSSSSAELNVGEDFPYFEGRKKKRKVEMNFNEQTDQMVEDFDGGFIGLKDEWIIVLEFLPIGSVLMLAMTRKCNYGWICGYVRRKARILIEKGLGKFSISRMLRMKNRMVVDSNNMKEICEIVKEISLRSGMISELSHGFIFNSIVFERIFSLFDIRKGLEYLEELTVATVCLPNQKILSMERILTQKQIKGIPIGYELKNLTLILEYSDYGVQTLYKILSKCRNLETCQIEVDENSGRHTTHPFSDDTFDENYIYVPLMTNLKRLDVNSFEDDEQFMYDLLKICPNLEILHYSCHATPSDQFLKFLSEMCPKLQSLTIETEFSEISDDGLLEFLTRQQFMKHLDIRPTPKISGKIFKHIGEFEKLEYFRIRRCNHYASIAPQLVDDFHFGTKVLPNLQYLDIGNNYRFTSDAEFDRFENSLKQTAPNLKDFYEMDKMSMKDSGHLVRLYANSLETTIGNSANLSYLHLCNNLKRVVLQIPENFKLDNISVCPNVVELKCRFTFDLEALLQLSRIFPSVELFEMTVFNHSINPLVESLNISTFWPKLVYLRIIMQKKEKLVNIIHARPNIYIEGKSFPVTPHTFYYLWLDRDANSKNENFLT